MSKNNSGRNHHQKLPEAETGNASNPSPAYDLRESATIEDYPDPKD